MAFNSLAFIVFLSVAILIYALFPKKGKAWCILGISYVFYGLYDWRVLIFLFAFSVMVYLVAIGIEKRGKTVTTVLGILVVLLPLLVCKYTEFAASLINRVIERLEIGSIRTDFNLILPLGISYFTFKSIGYLVDVSKGKIRAERNFAALAAFLAFFPEMLIGPIDRASNLLVQIKQQDKKLEWKSIEMGVLILFGGFFEKMVVADRLGILVNKIYGDLYSYEGVIVLVAVFAYSLQIYFDFAGCTYMAIGVGKILGFRLPENFRQPYLATSVEEFWRRWHISLTSWLRDYIYIPLGGNRKGTFRKYIHVMIVFLVSGIWHGAGLNFIVWGGLNGIFQITGTLLKQTKSKIYRWLHIKEDGKVCIWWKRIWTFLWMTVAWIFFRASSVQEGFLVLAKIVRTWNPWVLFDGTMYRIGLSQRSLYLLILLLLVMALVEVLHEKKISLTQWVMEQHFIVKCLVSYGLILAVLVWGIYGTAYDAGSFIYMKF